ncbi:MAG: protein translocase subunit SecD [Patescibacteria group bacterium]
MRIRLWITLIFILALAGLAGWLDRPESFKLGSRTITVHEGLDLQGGTHLVYALDTSQLDPAQHDQAQRGVVEVINRRINALGVSEPIIQRSQIGNTRTVIVELPGVSDVEQAKNLIGKTAQLTFWEGNPEANDPSSPLGPGWKQTELTGAHLQRADVDIQGGASSSTSNSTTKGSQPIINIEFTPEGGQLFEAITARNVSKPVAIVLDNQVISAPTVQEKISGGKAIISGVGTISEANTLKIQLNAGALPVPINVIEERTVGATLGNDSVRRSLIAGVIGFIIIAIFMLSLYRLAGLLAILALIIYTLLTLAVFKLIPVTLTLAGIAGFILSIGMAVDANILIFERFREERRAGRALKAAIEEGFRRAWSSVRDSNVSSLITATILFYFGTGLVRGFALTLFIGILISMFTAITVTRTFLRLALQDNK